MILVDTSLWVDHLKAGHPALAQLLERGLVLCHPWVVGEVALGHLRQRAEILGLLTSLPRATIATDAEILTLIQSAKLYATGIGYVDAQLLAATKLTSDAVLWTKDRRLASAASTLGVAFEAGAFTERGTHAP